MAWVQQSQQLCNDCAQCEDLEEANERVKKKALCLENEMREAGEVFGLTDCPAASVGTVCSPLACWMTLWRPLGKVRMAQIWRWLRATLSRHLLKALYRPCSFCFVFDQEVSKLIILDT
jgi:hypothetical protein